MVCDIMKDPIFPAVPARHAGRALLYAYQTIPGEGFMQRLRR